MLFLLSYAASDLPTLRARRREYPLAGGCGAKVMPAIISALHVEKQWVVGVMREMAQEEGFNIQVDGVVHQWLGRSVEWGGVEASRLLQVFCKISRLLE
jgi:hypothetical protein